MEARIVAAALLFASGSALATEYVPGYIRSDGTYVQGHFRSSPNTTTLDNYSTKGNVNPYTGERGTVDPYRPKQPDTYRYTPPQRPQTYEYKAPSYDYRPPQYQVPTYREYKY